MAYIVPNSTVLLLHNVPLDSSYQHTIYWGTPIAQAQWFQQQTIANGAFAQLAYVRPETGIIRVEQVADKLYACNYMMYRNTAYADKWFYAFVDRVIYISDTCTEIRFTIDELQTWFFEANFRPCLVERNHLGIDIPGSSVTTEPVEIGPLRCSQINTALNLSNMSIITAYAGSSGSDGGGGDNE